MKKKLLLTLLLPLVGLSSFFVGNQVSAENKKAKVVNAYSLNMRDKGSNSGKIVAVLKRGTTVTVLNSTGSWDYVQYGSKKGYVYDKYIQVISSSNVSTKKGTVTAYSLNLRQNASASSKILAVLKKNQTVAIASQTGSWYRVNVNGKTGYVHQNYIKTTVTSTPTTSKSSTSKPTTSTSTTSAPSANTTTYKVQKNDTLYKISRTYNVSVTNLKKWNNLSSNLIRTGQVLHINSSSVKPNQPTSSSITKTLQGKTIVIDPGHGDGRPGAIGNGIVEKNLNYSVSLKAKEQLEQKGAKVVFTRHGDTDCNPQVDNSQDLLCRAQVASKANAHLFISIHANAGSANANGAETFYYTASSKQFATTLQNAYVKETGLKHRRTAFGDFGVLRNNKVTAALIELGFITNVSDAAKLKSDAFQNKAATGIVKGIETYYGK